jgi:hypothetical protein
MNKFSLVLPDKLEEFDKRIWHFEDQGIHRYYNRLVGLKLTNNGHAPVYQPLISTEKRAGQTYLEFHFSRYTGLIFMFDRWGVHPKYYDFRKEYADG